MVSEQQVNLAEAPVRLFQSDLLERFTHVHPAAIVVLWVPVIAWFLSRPFADANLGGGAVLAAFVTGLVIWTFTEYTMHRFIFHFAPANPPRWLSRGLFLLHGVHHYQPNCKTRLVMPPLVSVPLAAMFLGLFQVVVGVGLGAGAWVAPLFGGFMTGYLGYDLIHYATHHLPMQWKPLRVIKRYHMQHHFVMMDRRFGVSSPLWDIVFRTEPEAGRAAAADTAHRSTGAVTSR